MNKHKRFFRILLGELQQLGPNIGSDLQTQVQISLSGQAISTPTVIGIPNDQDARLTINIDVTEVDTATRYHDQGTGSIVLSFPEQNGNFQFQIPVIVTTKGGDRAPSSLYVQHLSLEIGGDEQLRSLSGRIQDVHLSPRSLDSLDALPELFARNNLLNRPVGNWEMGGFVGVEGPGMRNGQSPFCGRELQGMTFLRDPESGYVLESHFAPGINCGLQVRQGLFDAGITPFTAPIHDSQGLEAGFRAAFTHLDRINPVTDRNVFHQFAYVPAQNWLNMYPDWGKRTDLQLTANDGIWAVMQIHDTGGRLIVFAGHTPNILLLDLQIPDGNLAFGLGSFASFGDTFWTMIKITGAILAFVAAGLTAATVVLILLAAFLFFIALMLILMELNAMAQQKASKRSTVIKLRKLQKENEKILKELEEQKKAMEDLIEKGKRDAEAEAKARKAIEDALKKLTQLVDEHKEVSEDDPGLKKAGFPELFEQVADAIKDFAKKLKKLFK